MYIGGRGKRRAMLVKWCAAAGSAICYSVHTAEGQGVECKLGVRKGIKKQLYAHF